MRAGTPDVTDIALNDSRNPSFDVPDGLQKAIREGRCVAFVGAGFSGTAVPSWPKLLRSIADSAKGSAPSIAIPESPSSRELEIAAQSLLDALGKKAFFNTLKSIVDVPPTEEVKQRQALLRQIPFKAILTTNFDPFLKAPGESRNPHWDILREPPPRWWSPDFWDKNGGGARVVKLHGDIMEPPDKIVLCTRQYRRKLYDDPAYSLFLRTVFASNTVLFLGYSFTDEYINAMRSEVLSMLDHKPKQRPIAYAVMADVPDQTKKHLLGHDGIEVLEYKKCEHDEGIKHAGFDSWLTAIFSATNPTEQLCRLLANKRVLWLDPKPANNEYAWKMLTRTGITDGSNETFTPVKRLKDAIEKLRTDGPFDLNITHWGREKKKNEKKPNYRTAERLLEHLRACNVEVPVLVFSSRYNAQQRRRKTLALGGQGYEYDWPELFQEINRILGDPHQT